MLQQVEATMAGTGKVHESFHKDNPSRFTRHDFGWADALYMELKKDDIGNQKTLSKATTYPSVVFEQLATTNAWGNTESLSGDGSTVSINSERVRFLDDFIRQYAIKRLYDIPCGDANWQHALTSLRSGTLYFGSDISHVALQRAKEKNKFHSNMTFWEPFNLITQVPPVQEEESSLFLLKEVIQHVPLDAGVAMLENIKSSGVRFLAVTHHAESLFGKNKNKHVPMGGFYPNNMLVPPFSLEAMLDINDHFELDSEKRRKGNLIIVDLYDRRSHISKDLKARNTPTKRHVGHNPNISISQIHGPHPNNLQKSFSVTFGSAWECIRIDS
jgi:hypothetical protein